MTQFRLQFDLADVRTIAARYSYVDDEPVVAIGRTARDRGWYTKDELVQVCHWKSPRTQPLIAQNTSAVVRAATERALSNVREEVRMTSLLELIGVSWPTASVLLHLGQRDPYPILDYRVLEALGVNRRSTYSMGFWLDYVSATRALAMAARVDMRTLDRSLWQWSKERVADASWRAFSEPSEAVVFKGAFPVAIRPDRVDADVIIVGCVSSKQQGPAMARDLYTSPLFHKRRRYAESSGLPWVIFSAEHGILAPDDIIEWYDVALKHLPTHVRRQKGADAASQLEARFGPLDGKDFEIHAGDAYVSALRERLASKGAGLFNRLEGLGIGRQLQWYTTHRYGDGR